MKSDSHHVNVIRSLVIPVWKWHRWEFSCSPLPINLSLFFVEWHNVFQNVILSLSPSCNIGIKWVLAWFVSFSRGFHLTCQSNRAIISLSHRITQPMTRSGSQTTEEKAFQFRTPSRCWLSMNKCQPPTKLTQTMPPGLWEAWYFCVWFLATCCFTHGFGRTKTIGGERRTTIATRSSVSWKTERWKPRSFSSKGTSGYSRLLTDIPEEFDDDIWQ